MDNINVQELPEVIRQIRASLQPYIKSKDEVKHIRKVLARHLESHVKTLDGTVGRPLSLVESTTQVEQCPSSVTSLHDEYLQSLRANLKAREEYAMLRNLDITNTASQISNAQPTDFATTGDPAAVLDSFIETVKVGRRLDRLNVIQHYFDVLARTADTLQPCLLSKDVDPVPKPPPEVLNHVSGTGDSDQSDFRELADRLGKSVLRAKLLLKKEQKLLAKLKNDAQMIEKISSAQRLRALEMTRNELIMWMEGELAKVAEESPEASETEASPTTENIENVEFELASIKSQYTEYVNAREALVLATTGQLKMQFSERRTVAIDDAREESYRSSTRSHTVYPLLEQLVSVANKQKSIIQQKSYFTVSLARQLKDTNQGLDRLAGESHLLPAYPLNLPSTHLQKQSGLVSLGEEASSHERPDTSHRARAWTFASETAGKATDSYVSIKLEESKNSTGEANETLLKIQRLLGGDIGGVAEGKAKQVSGQASYEGIWTQLDGNLGAINSSARRS